MIAKKGILLEYVIIVVKTGIWVEIVMTEKTIQKKNDNAKNGIGVNGDELVFHFNNFSRR